MVIIALGVIMIKKKYQGASSEPKKYTSEPQLAHWLPDAHPWPPWSQGLKI